MAFSSPKHNRIALDNLHSRESEFRLSVLKEEYIHEVSQAALDAERRQAMSSISILLIRNLRDVFGENDPARRRAAIDELYTEDVVFYDPSKGVYRGRDEIDRIAGVI